MSGCTVLGLGLLAGCATERWSYSKPGLTPARLDRDLGRAGGSRLARNGSG